MWFGIFGDFTYFCRRKDNSMNKKLEGNEED